MLWAEINRHVIGGVMSDVRTGLEGVVVVETEIAEPDRDGGALRYRGVDLEEIVGRLRFEQVWGLLVDGSSEPGLSASEPVQLVAATGDPLADLQAATARLAGTWRMAKLIDLATAQVREDLRRVSAAMLSLTAQAARHADGHTDALGAADVAGAAERFLLEWRGEADPRHVIALDTYWVCTAEHGLNASTFTARIAASTGADCAAALSAAAGALSGPLHGGGARARPADARRGRRGGEHRRLCG
jgi:citrate synthase